MEWRLVEELTCLHPSICDNYSPYRILLLDNAFTCIPSPCWASTAPSILILMPRREEEERQLPKDYSPTRQKSETHPSQLFCKTYHPTWKCFQIVGASFSPSEAQEVHALFPFTSLAGWGSFYYSRAGPQTEGWPTGISMGARHITQPVCPHSELYAALLIRELKRTGLLLKENKFPRTYPVPGYQWY